MLRLLYLFFILTASLQANPKWTTDAMMATKAPSDVQIAPHKQSVLFVVAEQDIAGSTGRIVPRIYRSDLNGSTRLFSAENAASFHPRWSPDGQWIAFLSNRTGNCQLYHIRADGGEAKQLTSGERNVGSFAWSPDGHYIAFAMEDETAREKNRNQSSQAIVYHEQSTVCRLWLIDPLENTPAPKPITTDDFCVKGNADFGLLNQEFDWSPDSRKMIFAHSPKLSLDSFYCDSSLAEIDLATGKITPWEKKARFESTPRYSPDGELVAYLSSDCQERYALNHQVAVRASDGTNMRLLSPTLNEGPFLVGPNLLGWNQSGDSVFFFEPRGTRFHLLSLPINGGRGEEVPLTEYLAFSPSLSHDRSWIGYIGQSPISPPDVYVAEIKHPQPIQATNLNEPLLSYPRLETQTISWKAADGQTIEGILTLPVGYEKGQPCPLLLVIHGGPMAFFFESYVGNRYVYPLAAFAQEGFMILRPNPRGSCGYGADFRCGNYRDWGGKDYEDIMAGVDHLIAQGMADPARLGVMGWSYGGYMTGWIITQTDRFRAASMGAGVSNLVSMSGTMDLERFIPDFFGPFSKNQGLYETRSPLYHASSVNTPCLIQHGDSDSRVPVSQSYEFYRALKQEGKQVEFILYPGMSHHISDPLMVQDSMDRNLAWFKKHLQDQ